MNTKPVSLQQVPAEVSELWAQLYDEAYNNYYTLKEQTAPKLSPRLIAIIISGVLLLGCVLAIGAWSGGVVNVPEGACDAVSWLCTPTPVPDTPTPTSTPTPTPTPTPYVVVQVVNPERTPVSVAEIGILEDTACGEPRPETSSEDLSFSGAIESVGAYIRLKAGQVFEAVTGDPPPDTGAPAPECEPGVDYYVQWPRWDTGEHTAEFVVAQMTPTPTPDYGGVLDGCTYEDFDYAVSQQTPISQTVYSRTRGPVSGLQTTFVFSNTGACPLVEGVVLEGNAIVAELPQTLGQGRVVELVYEWPELDEGEHKVSFSLRVKDVNGKPYLLEQIFNLELDLTILLDRDGDRVPDANDSCPNEPGLPELGGCPDKDGDGVIDSEDCCPDKFGRLSGCPDADGDGFAELNTKGCPAVLLDGCPGECGLANGCANCHTVSETCTRKVCQSVTDPSTGEVKEECHDESYTCNEHEECPDACSP